MAVELIFIFPEITYYTTDVNRDARADKRHFVEIRFHGGRHFWRGSIDDLHLTYVPHWSNIYQSSNRVHPLTDLHKPMYYNIQTPGG